MENEIVNADTPNGETGAEEVQTTEAPAHEVDVAKLQETNKQLYERAKKAEAEAKELRSKTTAQSPKPDIYDTDRLDRLELTATGVKNPDDQKLVLDEAKRLKLPISEIANMEYMQAKLKANQEARDVKDGLPNGTRRAGTMSKQDVEYYLANPDKRPDNQELAEKVLSAKQAREKSTNQFSDMMFN
jgi:hypothetical protein